MFAFQSFLVNTSSLTCRKARKFYKKRQQKKTWHDIVMFQRFPKDISAASEFDVDMYFSPLAPLDRPQGNRDIQQIEMKMKRGGKS